MQLGSSTHRGILFALIAIMFAFAVPTIAVARVTVPPGATEGDQYFEEVPNGGGVPSPPTAAPETPAGPEEANPWRPPGH